MELASLDITLTLVRGPRQARGPLILSYLLEIKTVLHEIKTTLLETALPNIETALPEIEILSYELENKYQSNEG